MAATVRPDPEGKLADSVDRFRSIEGARAVLALWVVLGHLLQQSGMAKALPRELSLLADANVPVGAFVVISGFVITHLIVRREEPYLPYIIRRFFRLAPLLYFCVGAVLVYGVFFPGVFKWDRTHTAEYVAGYATMLHGILPNEFLADAPRSILPPAWSTSLEWQFYLVAPLILWKRSRIFLLVAAVAAVLLTRKNLFTWFGLTFDHAFLPTMLLYFLVGIGSYYAVVKIREPSMTLAAALAGAAVIFGISGDVVFVVWSLVLAAVLGATPMRFTMESAPLVWLGTISYSIYLTHMIVIMPVRKQIVEGMLGLEFGSWTHFAASSAITVPIVILVSGLTWFLIERPGQRLGAMLARSLSKPKTEAPSPVASPAE